jgi:glycosyltransferase involved in cell wall biosynthesis
MRVLLISHTCQSATEGQPKALELAQIPGVELCVLSPDRWKHYGQWRPAETPPVGAGYRFEAGRVRWPWVGPAQFYLHWYPRLASLLRDFRPHVIDLWEEPWALVSGQACWLRNRLLPGTKIISETEQNIDKVLPWPFEKLRDYSLRNADFAVGRSAGAVKVLRAKGYSGPAEIVPNAVDAQLFQPMDRQACRKKLGLDSEAFIVGYVGRLVEEKGLTDAVEALALCPPKVKLVMIGTGPMREALLSQAESAGVAGRLHFLGSLAAADLPQAMNALDVLILPSRTTHRWKEQFGRVIIEAHACAVPVIGSDSGAIPDVIGDGGLIVSERSAAELAAAIARMAADPSMARALGRTGRIAVEKHYTWQRVAQRMASIYQRVVDPSTHGTSATHDVRSCDSILGAGACRPGRAQGTRPDLRSDRADTARLQKPAIKHARLI